MIKILNGDLLSADADVICQQVNCRNVMGAGLAKAIYTKWPIVKELYHEYCDQVGDPFALLGDVQIVRAPDIPFDIANVFGQLNYGRQKLCYTSYDALRAAFRELARRYEGKTVAFPYGFGCGLAGGSWDTVVRIMEQAFVGNTVVIYRYESRDRIDDLLYQAAIKNKRPDFSRHTGNALDYPN